MTVDMFNNQNIPALSSFEQEERPQHPPLLYVGKRFLLLPQMRIGNNSVFPFGPCRDKTCLQGFAINKGADQPAHPRRLISAFVIRPLEGIKCKLAIGEISILSC